MTYLLNVIHSTLLWFVIVILLVIPHLKSLSSPLICTRKLPSWACSQTQKWRPWDKMQKTCSSEWRETPLLALLLIWTILLIHCCRPLVWFNRQVEGLRLRIAGKSVPTEKFAAKKAQRCSSSRPTKPVLPALVSTRPPDMNCYTSIQNQSSLCWWAPDPPIWTVVPVYKTTPSCVGGHQDPLIWTVVPVYKTSPPCVGGHPTP